VRLDTTAAMASVLGETADGGHHTGSNPAGEETAAAGSSSAEAGCAFFNSAADSLADGRDPLRVVGTLL
jgi:hypothetical protein